MERSQTTGVKEVSPMSPGEPTIPIMTKQNSLKIEKSPSPLKMQDNLLALKLENLQLLEDDTQEKPDSARTDLLAQCLSNLDEQLKRVDNNNRQNCEADDGFEYLMLQPPQKEEMKVDRSSPHDDVQRQISKESGSSNPFVQDYISPIKDVKIVPKSDKIVALKSEQMTPRGLKQVMFSNEQMSDINVA